jgi:hypothetical protein
VPYHRSITSSGGVSWLTVNPYILQAYNTHLYVMIILVSY